MAQPSKKDHIATSALPLFFIHGIKGTSVDMVVKTSKVSKPTIYNHFPDKGALFLHVVQLWINTQAEPNLSDASVNSVLEVLEQKWLSEEALKLYALVIGEGNRAPEAAQLFKDTFDTPWRTYCMNWAVNKNINALELSEKISHLLLSKLMAH